MPFLPFQLTQLHEQSSSRRSALNSIFLVLFSCKEEKDGESELVMTLRAPKKRHLSRWLLHCPMFPSGDCLSRPPLRSSSPLGCPIRVRGTVTLYLCCHPMCEHHKAQNVSNGTHTHTHVSLHSKVRAIKREKKEDSVLFCWPEVTEWIGIADEKASRYEPMVMGFQAPFLSANIAHHCPHLNTWGPIISYFHHFFHYILPRETFKISATVWTTRRSRGDAREIRKEPEQVVTLGHPVVKSCQLFTVWIRSQDNARGCYRTCLSSMKPSALLLAIIPLKKKKNNFFLSTWNIRLKVDDSIQFFLCVTQHLSFRFSRTWSTILQSLRQQICPSSRTKGVWS